MFPFSGLGPFDRSERKALLFAVLYSCVFLVIVSFARPRTERVTRIQIEGFEVPTPLPNKLPQPETLSADSLEVPFTPAQFDGIDFPDYSYGPYKTSDGTKFDLTLAHGRL